MHAEPFAGVEFQQRNAFHDFAFGFLKDFAFFTRKGARDLVCPLARNIGSAPQYPSALRTRGCFPLLKCSLGGGNSVLHVFGCGGRKLGDHIIGIGGVQVSYEPVRFWMKPFAVYVRTGLHFCSPSKLEREGLRRFPGEVAHGLIPLLLELFDLLGGLSLLRVPTFEAVVFGSITVFVLFENLLTAFTQDKISQ